MAPSLPESFDDSAVGGEIRDFVPGETRTTVSSVDVVYEIGS